MSRLNLREFLKGLGLALLGGAAGFYLFGTLAGWPADQSAWAAGFVATVILLVAGLAGMGYMLAQASAGTELAAHTFGSTMGAAVGAFEAARRASKGTPESEAVAAAQAALPGASLAEQRARDTGGPDGADPISRFRLNNALTNTVIRFHAGARISRQAMTGEGVVDQRYWNLANRAAIAIGLRHRNTSKWLTRGSEALDLMWVTARVKVVAHSQIWVLPESASRWSMVEPAAPEMAGVSLNAELTPALG